MYPLTFVLALLCATAVTGPALVAAFSLGLYNWPAVVLALALGFFAAGALARPIEEAIKGQDPAWDEIRDRPRHPPRPCCRVSGSRRDGRR
jgi:hypothetical protein